MAENTFPYIPASQGFYNPPLGRFLPSLPRGVFHSWIKANCHTGDLLLDPLGAHPLLPIEAANAGARILVARNNPILWLLLESAASAPTTDQSMKVLSKLLISRRGGETIEDHLRAIYATPCSSCGQMVQATGFIWEKGNRIPLSRVYSCPQCGDEGEREISDEDLENLSGLGNLGLHRARAFQRVLLGGEYEQESIEGALDCYLPRALYVCMTLVNRLDRLDLTKAERRLLRTLLLPVFDDATSLWHWPSRDQKYYQLSIPAKFIEKNLWLSLENAPERLEEFKSTVPVSYWPNLPQKEGGICLYQRRLAEKQDLFKDERPNYITSIYPRPNQAFWTFSALWSGWLWGREAVSPMRSALARRRYDWRWFAQALEAAFKDLPKTLKKGTKTFGILSQGAPNHFLGLLTGMNASGFQLNGYAFSNSDEVIQCQWHCNGNEKGSDMHSLRDTIRSFLEIRGEPCNFQQIINDNLAQYAMQGNFPADVGSLDDTYFSGLQQRVSDLLRNEHFTLSYQPSPTSSSKWWLLDSRQSKSPLSERMETAMRETLLDQPLISLLELESKICSQLPGRETPESEVIRVCLDSYADPQEYQFGLFKLRLGESSSEREKDVEEMASLLEKCCQSFKLEVSQADNVIEWLDKGKCVYRFIILTTCVLMPYLSKFAPTNKEKNVLVFPGSHSRWLVYRMRQDTRLEQTLNGNWHLLKYRYLRWLAARGETNLKTWDELLDGDPPRWEASVQIPML